MTIGDDPDEPGPSASPPCFLHEFDLQYLETAGDRRSPAGTTTAGRLVMRLLPGRPLPPYAYLPGRFPHPVRDPSGHSFQAHAAPTQAEGGSDPDAVRWGADLFNHGFYWEAHEVWEDRWRSSPKDGPERDVLHGLILLAAAGVKLREDKWGAARRHGLRAASYLRRAHDAAVRDLVASLGWSPSALAAKAEQAVLVPVRSADNTVAFDFTLGCATANSPVLIP